MLCYCTTDRLVLCRASIRPLGNPKYLTPYGDTQAWRETSPNSIRRTCTHHMLYVFSIHSYSGTNSVELMHKFAVGTILII